MRDSPAERRGRGGTRRRAPHVEHLFLKQGYEAFGRFWTVPQSFADDVRWENPKAPQIPNNGTTEGKDNVSSFSPSSGTAGIVLDHPG